MKTVFTCILVLFALSTSQAFAAGPFGSVDDIVVVFCERESGASGSVFVTHAASSPGSPTVAVGPDTNCAQELAKLTNVKFHFQSVVPADSSFVVYTLVRR